MLVSRLKLNSSICGTKTNDFCFFHSDPSSDAYYGQTKSLTLTECGYVLILKYKVLGYQCKRCFRTDSV